MSSPHSNPDAHDRLTGDERRTSDLQLVGQVLKTRLRAPIAALRASLEAIAREPDTREPARDREHRHARAALDQVVGLGRVVQDLIDLALPPPIRPIACTIDEVAAGAMAELGSDQRSRVLLALENRRARLAIDGPLLSRRLAQLITEGLRSLSGEILVRAQSHGASTTFRLIHESGADTGARTETDGLERALAERDIRRMGASISFQTTSEHRLCEIGGITTELREGAAA